MFKINLNTSDRRQCELLGSQCPWRGICCFMQPCPELCPAFSGTSTARFSWLPLHPQLSVFPSLSSPEGLDQTLMLKELDRHHLLCHQVWWCLLTGAVKCSYSLGMWNLALQRWSLCFHGRNVSSVAEICRLTSELGFLTLQWDLCFWEVSVCIQQMNWFLLSSVSSPRHFRAFKVQWSRRLGRHESPLICLLISAVAYSPPQTGLNWAVAAQGEKLCSHHFPERTSAVPQSVCEHSLSLFFL